MKILVYGCGVIGSYLTHVLCSAGNDVTVLARGKWKEQLESKGLCIRHHLQRKSTVDHPKVIGSINEAGEYDAVFAVMPYDKMGLIVDDLAAVRAPVVVLVGNNMSAEEMRKHILENTACPKQVLFGFQTSAGKRDVEKGEVLCDRAGTGFMDIGCLRSLPDKSSMRLLEDIFKGTGYKLRRQPDMSDYYTCHLAAILPIGYLTYACGGDMRSSTSKQRKQMFRASREAYDMLKSSGHKIVPEGDDKYWGRSMTGAMMKLVYFIMSKTVMGDLIACLHCRNAYNEMELLDRAFEKIIAGSPDADMTNWNALKAQMPSWEEIRRTYSKK